MFTLLYLLLFAADVADFFTLFLFHNFPSLHSHLNNVLKRLYEKAYLQITEHIQSQCLF